MQAPFSFKRWRIFLFYCCLEEYKLVSPNTTNGFQGINSCRAACSEHGMVVMPLDSDDDRKAIVGLEEYKVWELVITASIEVVDNFASSTFFSRPGGKRVDFIRHTWPAGRWQLLRPRTYSVIIHYNWYYTEDYFSNEFFKYKDIKCACKWPGESRACTITMTWWCIYCNRRNFRREFNRPFA